MGGDGKSGTEGDWRGPQRVGGDSSTARDPTSPAVL